MSDDGRDLGELPTDCPRCASTLETRDDAIVHMIGHAGDDDD